MKLLVALIALLMIPAAASAGTAPSSTITGPTTLGVKQPEQCAFAGVPIGNGTSYRVCCPGLTPMNTSFPGGYDGNCGMPALRPGHVCSPCGNNKCDAATGENICNCPQDCDPAM